MKYINIKYIIYKNILNEEIYEKLSKNKNNDFFLLIDLDLINY